jgi:predicted acylesterase/phospholipase RssA
MKILTTLALVLLLNVSLYAEKKEIDLSMVISGGVSLGAYEAGYNWAMIKMLSNIKNHSQIALPHLRSVTGASAGSINALISAIYWCQEDDQYDLNTIDNNLFYNTWVKLGLDDLIINGRDPNNKSTLFSRKTLNLRAKEIFDHMNKPIFQKGCEVPIGFAVTKSTPMVTEFQKSGIKIKNQHFTTPFTLKEVNGKLKIYNRPMAPSTDYHIAIPNIENNLSHLRNVLFASSAFPGAFQQIKLDYIYEGKRESAYFIDGGAYDNLPLQLATELDPRAKDFIFIDPSNIRGIKKDQESNQTEKAPIGFLGANAMPLLNASDIFQSMRLYNAIAQYFTEDSGRRLILSSRYHPITGKFLSHFGAFLHQDFRIYDYYVGLYDAIYHLSKSMQKRGYYTDISQEQLMDRLQKELGVESYPVAFGAYRLFFDTEFKGLKSIPTTDKFSAIYNAFDLNKSDQERYDLTGFNNFLDKLDLHYLNDPHSYIPSDRSKLDGWYKTPINLMINRITTLENDYAEVDGNTKAFARMTNMLAWMGNNLVKEKQGFISSLNIPEDQKKTPLAKTLMLLPSEITSDVKNGGIGFGYNSYYYRKNRYIDAFELKLSLNQSDDISSFVRLDTNIFNEYKDFIKVGGGASFFGNIESKFYDPDGLYGINIYVDLLDIFRLTYVQRFNHPTEKSYLYFGLRNIPSLIYWLQR